MNFQSHDGYDGFNPHPTSDKSPSILTALQNLPFYCLAIPETAENGSKQCIQFDTDIQEFSSLFGPEQGFGLSLSLRFDIVPHS